MSLLLNFLPAEIIATNMSWCAAVPSQPSNLRATDIGETSVVLHWSKPVHAGENIVSYELYWNDTYAEVGASLTSPRLIRPDRGTDKGQNTRLHLLQTQQIL